MPAAASAPRNGTNPASEAERDLQHKNHQAELLYRKIVSAQHRVSASKERVINEDSKQITGGQSTVRIVENVETGEIFVHRYFGDTKNIPTALRLKRSADEMLDDEEGGGQGEEQDLNDEEAQASADIAGRKKKRAPTRSAAKKQKKAAPPPDSDAPRATHQNEAGAYAPGTRRSARVSNANVSTSSSASSSQTPGPTVARREPVIREDAEENHTTTVQDGPSDGLHHIDDYNLRRSTRAASDDLNALSDRMNMFEIKSEAGSESTRVFSRESSRADTVASTSRR